MTSAKWDFNIDDFKKVLKNALIFLAPLGVIYLGFVINIIKTNGFSLEAFIPNVEFQGLLVLYILNVLTDALRKLSKDNTQVQG